MHMCAMRIFGTKPSANSVEHTVLYSLLCRMVYTTMRHSLLQELGLDGAADNKITALVDATGVGSHKQC